MTTAALFGVAGVSGIWRAAMGPIFSRNFDAKAPDPKSTGPAPVDWSLEAELPFLLSLSKSMQYKGDYEGIIRFLPSVGAQRGTDGKFSPAASFSVALLGKRTMFGPELYRQ